MKPCSAQYKNYYKEIWSIGIPVTLQSIFQASYSLVDQLMVGQLGSTSIAGSGLGAKFSSLVTVTLSAIAAVASILISQYRGSKDEKEMNRSFFLSLYMAAGVALAFTVPTLTVPYEVMRIYTYDVDTCFVAAGYLRIIGISFMPMMVTLLISAYLRSIEQSKYPLYASVVSMGVNIVLNYLLIFGKLGLPILGLNGAALGTLIARLIEAMILVQCLRNVKSQQNVYLSWQISWNLNFVKRIISMMGPILANEFLWSLGENIYAMIYGRIGRDALAAMTVTSPVQGLLVGMFTGISSAAVVMIGKRLGESNNEEAYKLSKFLMKIGFLGSIGISLVLVAISPYYIKLFNISQTVGKLTCYILYAFACILFAKVANMIMGGGILRSGGNTKLTLIIDLIGTWGVGIPLGLIAAFIFHLPVYWVYFILSLEELVRLGISIVVFRQRKWMQNITHLL